MRSTAASAEGRATMAGVVSALDAAMAQVGDRWTLQVVEALLGGPRRFSELQAAIPGVAPNVLTARLRRLERFGLVLASPYSERPPRLEYQVTAIGRELAGAVALLTRWGARDAGPDTEGPRHRACGTALEARWYCPTCALLSDEGDEEPTWV